MPLGLVIWTYLVAIHVVGPVGLGTVAPVAERLGIVVLFTAVYLAYWLRVWPSRSSGRADLVVAGVVLLAAFDRMAGGVPGAELCIYAAVVAGCGLTLARSVPAIVLLALFTLISVDGSGVAFAPSDAVHVTGPAGVDRMVAAPAVLLSTALSALPVFVAGGGAALLTSMAKTNAELHAARMRLARVAVDEERARLSRDLHDLLGHSLSLIALKAELASRLLDRPAGPATAELDDLKLLARSALADLREVVGGARLPTLAGELDGARIAAEAASIDLQIEDQRVGALTPEVEAACAWIVREGMTNVVKHSGARTCRLRIEQRDGSVVVTLSDDGHGGNGAGRGAGLRGLGERISAVGGQLRVQPGNGGMGGFLLAARVPLGPESPIP